jgi:predicted nucleic acid-binding protein
MIYVLDTNAVSDLIDLHPSVRARTIQRVNTGGQLMICRPVYYEVLRGLLWRNATTKLRYFRMILLPLLTRVELKDEDWEEAAKLWASARSRGRQLGDPDLLVAALAIRLNAVVVSADADFDALPVTRENWR